MATADYIHRMHNIDTTHITGRLVRVPNHRFVANGTKSYVHALLKYNITPTKPGPFVMGARSESHSRFSYGGRRVGGHKTMQNHLVKRRPGSNEATTGEVEAEDVQHDSEYLCPVTIGTPGQRFMLDFDTGSADLWVWSTELPKRVLSQHAKDHTIYNHKHSSTYQPLQGYRWKIEYGDDSTAEGNVGTDTVDIGGIKIRNQAIELAEELSSSFVRDVADGLLGLAFDNINTVTPRQVHTPVENMIQQMAIPGKSELFTAYLGSYKDSNEADKGESFYTFGHIDTDALNWSKVGLHDIHYTPVDPTNGFWQFSSTSAKIGGIEGMGATVVHLGASNTAIADTGTTLALLSDEVCDQIYKKIKGAFYDQNLQGYVFPMNTTANGLPAVEIKVGEHFFYIQKEYLAYADAGNGYVYGGVQSRGDMPFDILGDVFLKGVYAIFDVGGKRFGAVQRIEEFQNIETKVVAAEKKAAVAEAQVAPAANDAQKPVVKEEKTIEKEKSVPMKEEPLGKTGV